MWYFFHDLDFFLMSSLFLLAAFVASPTSGKPLVEHGVNAEGYTFTIREGSEVIFDPVNTCSEAALLPGYNFHFLTKGSKATVTTPCARPVNGTSEHLDNLAAEGKITSEVFCHSGSKQIFKLTCFVDGKSVSRRVAPIVKGLNNIASIVGCDNATAALHECVQSVSNMIAFKDNIVQFMNPSLSSPHDDQPSHTVDEIVATPTSPPTETVPVAEETTSSQTESPEERKLSTSVTGENLAHYAFEISDGGLVTFLPRAGQQCTETFSISNASVQQILTAVSNTTVIPCGAFPKAMTTASVDPSWSIIPTVDCNDSEYIEISCQVSFGSDEIKHQMTRRAIYQVGDSRTFLSKRIGCNGISDNEILECATIAKNFARVVAQISN